MKKKTIIYKIGNDDRPARDEDIRDFKHLLKKAIKENSDLITHHAVTGMEITYDPEKQRIIWKVGSEGNPASQADIDRFSRKLKKAYRKQKKHNRPYATVITYHEVGAEIVDLS